VNGYYTTLALLPSESNFLFTTGELDSLAQLFIQSGNKDCDCACRVPLHGKTKMPPHKFETAEMKRKFQLRCCKTDPPEAVPVAPIHRSRKKVLVTTFFDSDGLVHAEFLLACMPFNKKNTPFTLLVNN
jgi:hypothetical protein